MTQTEAHNKVLNLLNTNVYTQVDLIDIIGKSKATINHRVKKGNWRQREINIIKDL